MEHVLAPAVALSAAEHERVARAASEFEDMLVTSALAPEDNSNELRVYVADIDVNRINRQRQNLLVKAREALLTSNKNVVSVEHKTERGALLDASKLKATGKGAMETWLQSRGKSSFSRQ